MSSDPVPEGATKTVQTTPFLTEDEARQFFRDAAAAAEAKLPASVAAKLTTHLRDVAEVDFGSTVGNLIAHAWHQCAHDLIAMEKQ